MKIVFLVLEEVIRYESPTTGYDKISYKILEMCDTRDDAQVIAYEYENKGKICKIEEFNLGSEY